MKPWKSEPRGAQLEAFVGAQGIRTSQFSTTPELIWFACRLFEIDPVTVKTVDAAATSIEALGKKERSARAKRNRGHLFPLEDFGSEPAKTNLRPTETMLDRMMEASQPEFVDGEEFNVTGQLDIDPAQLLRKVVSAVISAGRADILWELPEVLAFFGAKIPTVAELGDVRADPRMFDAAAKWPNRA